MEQKCYVLRKTQTSVGCRTEPSISSARFYIGALCNSATKLAAPKSGAALFCVYAYPRLGPLPNLAAYGERSRFLISGIVSGRSLRAITRARSQSIIKRSEQFRASTL